MLIDEYVHNRDHSARRSDYFVYAHAKKNQGSINPYSVNDICVRKGFYSRGVEKTLNKIENRVQWELNKFRHVKGGGFDIDISKIFNFLTFQVIRTPKFRKKLKRDLLFFKGLPDDEFQQQYGIFLVKKPEDVTDETVKDVHEGMITNNLLNGTKIYESARISVVSNLTGIPFMTSDAPAVYSNIHFLPANLNGNIHPLLIISKPGLLFMPLSPNHAVTINIDVHEREKMEATSEIISDPNFVMKSNMITYQCADRFVIMNNNDKTQIDRVKSTCNGTYDIEYKCISEFHEAMKKKLDLKEELKSTA